jgi:hypothetical protein
LFGIRDFEVCASCETLKQQLEFERAEKKQLTDTLLSIVHPKVIEQPVVELNPVIQTSGLFSRRRAALEERGRQEAKIIKEAKHLGQPDALKNVANVAKDVENLEKELGIEEKEA